MTLQTEFDFVLPKGYADDSGSLHREGTMRLARARDEIEPLRDPRVQANEAYLTVIILSRVITKLGSVSAVTTKTIEGLFASDLAFLQDMYSIINFGDPSDLEALQRGATGPLAEEPPPPTEGTSPTPEGESSGPETRSPRRRGTVEEVAPAEA